MSSRRTVFLKEYSQLNNLNNNSNIKQEITLFTSLIINYKLT